MYDTPSPHPLDLVETIVLEASKLPIESQEYVLVLIRGMLFTKEQIEKKHKEEALKGMHRQKPT